MCTGNGRPVPVPVPQPRSPRTVAEYLVSLQVDSQPAGDAAGRASAITAGGVPADPSGAATDRFRAINRHRSAVGRHLDSYLASVARELQDSGVIAGSLQRSDPSVRLIGSIVLDCTALRLAAWAADDQAAERRSLGGAVHPERATPVVATWDESMGWCVGLHVDPAHTSRRYLHPELLPAARIVADFVVALALGQRVGAAHPISTVEPDHPRLRLLP